MKFPMLVKRKTDRQSLSTPANKKNPGRRGARPGGGKFYRSNNKMHSLDARSARALIAKRPRRACCALSVGAVNPRLARGIRRKIPGWEALATNVKTLGELRFRLTGRADCVSRWCNRR